MRLRACQNCRPRTIGGGCGGWGAVGLLLRGAAVRNEINFRVVAAAGLKLRGLDASTYYVLINEGDGLGYTLPPPPPPLNRPRERMYHTLVGGRVLPL